MNPLLLLAKYMPAAMLKNTFIFPIFGHGRPLTQPDGCCILRHRIAKCINMSVIYKLTLSLFVLSSLVVRQFCFAGYLM